MTHAAAAAATASRLLALAFLAACGSGAPRPLPDLSPAEIQLREQLGIPLDAEQVVFFGQSSHLDLDWQHTFDDYDRLYVEDLLHQATDVLSSQPRATYSIAEMAFLQRHLALHPEEAAPLRAAAARGALHVVGGGMTSPDTLLPETELLARDYLDGLAFAEETLGVRPTAAWLPDSFGHGAATPDLLAAAGFTSVGMARIDGAPGLLDLVHDPAAPPLPGSTADLLRTAGSADFVWKGSGGATILAHYLAGSGLYCQGDNLDYSEPFEPAGGHLGAFDDSPAFTDASIDRYVRELTPYARTRNLFVPVGCDFAAPKAALVAYLDGYDRRRYPTTHVWAVDASFETYEQFLALHADALPVIDHELSPYFMGFYGSRAAIKRGVRDAARPFWVAETFATLLGAEGAARVAAARPALALLTRADHHDFITGTSTDDVVTGEQLPLLATAQAAGEAAERDLADAIGRRIAPPADLRGRFLALDAASAAERGAVELDVPTADGSVPAVHAVAGGADLPMEPIAPPVPGDRVVRYRAQLEVPAFGWQAIDLVPGLPATPPAAVTLELLDDAGQPAAGDAVARVVLANAAVRSEWTRVDGRFALTSLVLGGHSVLAGPSMIVRDYHDDGGLWRLGHEMPGCAYTADPAGADHETVQVLEAGRLGARVAFVGADATREAALTAGADALDVAITTAAPLATTRTVDLALASTDPLSSSVPGGAAVRPGARVYAPTYWAAVSWARTGDVAVLLRQSTGARMDSPGALELMVARDARQEGCDVEGGTGTDTGVHRIEWRLVRAPDDAAADRQAQAFDRPLSIIATGAAPAGAGDLPAAGTLLSVVDGDGLVSAFKPADRGAGLVLRVLGRAPSRVRIDPLVPLAAAPTATAVDLAERDLDGAVPLTDRTVSFDPSQRGSIETVRLASP